MLSSTRNMGMEIGTEPPQKMVFLSLSFFALHRTKSRTLHTQASLYSLLFLSILVAKKNKKTCSPRPARSINRTVHTVYCPHRARTHFSDLIAFRRNNKKTRSIRSFPLVIAAKEKQPDENTQINQVLSDISTYYYAQSKKTCFHRINSSRF